MTTIQDIVTYADGSVASGQIILNWPPFQYASVAVAAGQKAFPIGPDGSITITCYPSVNSLPPGIYYIATYQLDKGPVYDEQWVVPDTATTTIGAIRAPFPVTPRPAIGAP